jgi:aspartyl protease family protein
MLKKLIGLTLIMLSTHSIAQEVKAILLSNDLAILTIDGKKQRLKAGQTIDGVTLIAANTQQASIKIGNEVKTLKLGSVAYRSEKITETIFKNDIGMFITTASINGGKEKAAVIDTGATTVAIDKKTAIELGIDYKKGQPVDAMTAAGKTTNHLIKLDSVKIGKIEIKDVVAVVGEEETNIILLGMTFLNQTTIVVNHDNIVLTKK